jgi:shikimate dehydrogenase
MIGIPLYGIIGYPLTHSFSPAYFRKKFAGLHIDAAFEAFELTAIDEFPALLQAHPQLRGLSVTIPYKQTVMPLLDELHTTAAEVGAVNSIAIKNGRTIGYNTDAIGFEQSLVPLLQAQHTHALVLGTGGASKAVAYALRLLGIPCTFVSRSRGNGILSYEELSENIIDTHKLIINTTPLGMYPHVNEAPTISFNSIGHGHLLFDLIYNPEETRFLKLGKERGATTKNGFEMLELQAEASWKIWTDTRLP